MTAKTRKMGGRCQWRGNEAEDALLLPSPYPTCVPCSSSSASVGSTSVLLMRTAATHEPQPAAATHMSEVLSISGLEAQGLDPSIRTNGSGMSFDAVSTRVARRSNGEQRAVNRLKRDILRLVRECLVTHDNMS